MFSGSAVEAFATAARSAIDGPSLARLPALAHGPRLERELVLAPFALGLGLGGFGRDPLSPVSAAVPLACGNPGFRLHGCPVG